MAGGRLAWGSVGQGSDWVWSLAYDEFRVR